MTSESKRTPGNWFVDGDYVRTEVGEHEAVAGPMGDTPEEALGNARLIAAAPTLLDALLAVRDSAGWQDLTYAEALKVEDAIAKALGDAQ